MEGHKGVPPLISRHLTIQHSAGCRRGYSHHGGVPLDLRHAQLLSVRSDPSSRRIPAPSTVERDSHDLENHTIGIFGMGSIGLRFAEMIRPFNMKMIYHNRRPSAKAPKDIEYVEDYYEFLKRVDVLSVHVPLSKATEKIVGEKEIRTMKKGSIIVNTARGKVIDEEAMIKALQDGHVSSAQYQPILRTLYHALTTMFDAAIARAVHS